MVLHPVLAQVQYIGNSVQVPWYAYLLNILVLLSGLFMILLILIQRGKGGGLSGAFGGAGGSSAFGSRAGDQFTRITLGAAGFWLLLTMLQVKLIQSSIPTPPTDVSTAVSPAEPSPVSPAPEQPESEKPKG